MGASQERGRGMKVRRRRGTGSGEEGPQATEKSVLAGKRSENRFLGMRLREAGGEW
jgi:hypothetical protein